MSGRAFCGPYLGAFFTRKCSTPRPLLGAPACWRLSPLGLLHMETPAPCALHFGPRVGTLGIQCPRIARVPPGAKNQAAAPREVAFAPNTFQKPFLKRPLPFTNTQTAEHPGGPISTNARGEPHPSGAPYKKPIPNSRFFGVAPRPDTPLCFRFTCSKNHQHLSTLAPSPLIGLFTFHFFRQKLELFLPPLISGAQPLPICSVVGTERPWGLRS